MCPIGVDQTERSPEQWHLLAPRLGELFPLAIPDYGEDEPSSSAFYYSTESPSEYLFSDQTWDSWSRLARPAVSRHALSSRKTPLPCSAHVKTELAPLERMPTELLTLIIESDTLEKEDVIALGLSSPSLWQHAVQQVRKACYQIAAPWANTPIACTGTYLTSLPPVFERDNPDPGRSPRIISQITQNGIRSQFSYIDRMCWARKFNWAAVSEHRKAESPSHESSAWTRALHKHLATVKVSAPAVRQMEEDISYEQLFASTDSNWLLRNLTAHEFVRCKAPMGGKMAHVDHPDSEWIRIDDVLMMRICWSRITRWASAEEQLPEAWKFGPWAGHSFEIVPQQEQTGLTAGEGREWRDVTLEVVKQARRVMSTLRRREIHDDDDDNDDGGEEECQEADLDEQSNKRMRMTFTPPAPPTFPPYDEYLRLYRANSRYL